MLKVLRVLVDRTTPSGSTSSRCLGRPQCMPVSTYCPGFVVLSRTRKSPSRTRSFSASRRLMRLWYHGSLRSCSSFGATGALRRGGLGHWSSSTPTPPPAPDIETGAPAAAGMLEPTTPPLASWSFSASSKGPVGGKWISNNCDGWSIQTGKMKTYSCQRGLSWDCLVPWPYWVHWAPVSVNSDFPDSEC